MAARIMENKRLKIVIIGGGSYAWTPKLCRDILLKGTLAESEIVLYDINKEAADLNRNFLENFARQAGVSPKIVATSHQASAFRNADYFIITLSTGGLAAMAYDLSIPEQYSIFHTVGDTTGPGGWARCIRNFDVFVSLAKAINRYAPGAMVLNYTNPMATLTDVLARICSGPVIGLCHGLFENLRFIREFYKLKSEEDIAAEYAGLNHFFWMTRVSAGGVDVVDDLRRRIKNRSLTPLLKKVYKDPMGFKSDREVATELFRMTGVLPYLGDRHTCECFPWYITNEKTMERYLIKRTTIAERRKMLAGNKKIVIGMLKGQINKEFFNASRETAADIICAHSQNEVFIDVGNVPNTGQISNLPIGAVVETAVRISANGVAPIQFGALPEPIASFCLPYARSFTMTIDACFEGDRHKALQALRLDPVCSHLTWQQVEEMGSKLLKKHKKFITAF